MTVGEAQREVRAVFINGAVSALVSGLIWLLSAALATWGTRRQAVLVLVVGGMFIFPITQILLRIVGRRFTLASANPLRWLAMQVAFFIPLTLPVVGAAAIHNPNWFYPGCMVVVGAHYLPFVFLYGMRHYAVLSALLVSGGVALGLAMPKTFTPGAWLTGVVLVLFAGWVAARKEPRSVP